MARRHVLATLLMFALVGTTVAAAEDPNAVRQEVADALKDPSLAFERYLTARLGEANATLAKTLARGGGSTSGNSGTLAASSSASSASLLSPAEAAQAATSLPPNLRVLVPAMSSGAERARRQAVFRTNLRRAALLNSQALRKVQAAGGSAADAPVYGVTDFSHLTPQEFRTLYLSKAFGQLKGRVDESDADAGVDAADAADASTNARRRLMQSNPSFQCKKKIKTFPFSKVVPPTTLDWRSVNGTSYVTPIRNQRSCGSCASFSTVVTLEAVSIRRSLARQSRNLGNAGTSISDGTDLSEQDFLDCWDPQTDECEGAMPSWYYDRATCKGVASEVDVPYKARDANACAAGVARDTLGLKGWFQPPTTDKGLKQAIAKAPVSIAIWAEDTFSMYRGGVMPCGTPDGSKQVNHAVAAIGWDASAFIVKNSWGTGWGDEGFVRLASGCAKGKSALNMHTPGYNVGVNF